MCPNYHVDAIMIFFVLKDVNMHPVTIDYIICCVLVFPSSIDVLTTAPTTPATTKKPFG